MTTKQQKEYAYLLYANKGKTLRQIADELKRHVNTISRWKNAEKWDELRETLLTTRQEQMRRLYMQLKELNDHIMTKSEGQRFANKAEADTLTQITRSIQNLEKDMSAAEVINVFSDFIKYVAKLDIEAAKTIVEFQDSYIKSMIK